MFEFARLLSVREGLCVRGVDRCLQFGLRLVVLAGRGFERRGELGLEVGGALLVGGGCGGGAQQRGLQRLDLAGLLCVSLLLLNRLGLRGVDRRLQSRLAVGRVAGTGLAGGG